MDPTEHAELEKSYRDRVTGFTGVATAHCEYAHAPDQVYLENADTARWFEESRLEAVTA